jgi:hypothetical protein
MRSAELGPGLAIFPGAASSGSAMPQVAAPWQPASELGDAAGRVRAEFVWAALDCPSWFGFAAFAQELPRALLGRLAVSIARRPSVGERCVVQGWYLAKEGRRILCGSALFDGAGECLAQARATWVELKAG